MAKTTHRDLERLTDGVLGSYDADERTQRIGRTFLPSHDRIVAILDLVRQLLFPGYFGAQQLSGQSVKYHVGNLLNRLGGELADEINHCLCVQQCPEPEKCMSQARSIAQEFLARVPAIREMLALDAQAAYDGDPAARSIDEVIYCYPGFYAITVYRVAHELWELGVPLMPRIMTEYAHSVTGIDIHPGASLGNNFFIDHGTGVVIGETTEIGDRVKIYQGVTLGALSFPKDGEGNIIRGRKRHPTLEDEVTIYSNATILGPVVIGARSVIGGNTWITHDVPPDTVVTIEQPGLRFRNGNEGE